MEEKKNPTNKPVPEVSLNPKLECVVAVARIAPVVSASVSSPIKMEKIPDTKSQDESTSLLSKGMTVDNPSAEEKSTTILKKKQRSRVVFNASSIGILPPIPILKHPSGVTTSRSRAASLKRVRLDPEYTHKAGWKVPCQRKSSGRLEPFDKRGLRRHLGEETKVEPVGIGRRRKFTFPVKWENHTLEGLEMSQHNPAFLNERRIQGFMLVDELKVLIDKVFQIRFTLQRGIKVRFPFPDAT